MVMRDINWIDIPFGLFVAGIVVVVSVGVSGIVAFVFSGQFIYEDSGVMVAVAAAALAVGSLLIILKFPGPGRIVERPLLALGAFMALPALVGFLTALGVVPRDPWYLPMLISGFFPSLVFGFAVLYATYSGTRCVNQPRTTWPIDRPASLGQGGVRTVPIGKVMAYAGLERAGPEEERPDTFLRMKTKE